MERPQSRRELFRRAGAGALVAGLLPVSRRRARSQGVAIASANGLRTVGQAWKDVQEGVRPVHAAVMGVGIQEADETDTSVGYGGLPNEDGVVQLDSACMEGPTHNAGAVAAIEDIMHPAQVAELVMERTDHVLIVGAGARRFALAQGFKPQDLLTDRAREAWLRWKASRAGDDWLSPLPGDAQRDRPWGTIHCSVLSAGGDLGCCTTTSGLAYKIPGRVGDSPLIGCGLYCDNEVGSAGSTGRGEAAIQSGGAWLVVERMRAGDSAREACLHALRRVARQVERQARWQPALQKEGRPAFQLRFYALRKDGDFGSASMLGQEGVRNFAVCTAEGARLESGAVLFPSG